MFTFATTCAYIIIDHRQEHGVFSSMYFMLNSTAEAEGRAEPVSLNIQHTAGGIRPLYTPYYSRWEYQRDYQQDGASEQAAARLPGYSFQYYEQQDMDVDWTRQTREMEESAEWFRQIQDIYGRDPDGLHSGAKGGGAVAGGPVQGASGIGPGGGHLGDPLCPGK